MQKLLTAPIMSHQQQEQKMDDFLVVHNGLWVTCASAEEAETVGSALIILGYSVYSVVYSATCHVLKCC